MSACVCVAYAAVGHTHSYTMCMSVWEAGHVASTAYITMLCGCN